MRQRASRASLILEIVTQEFILVRKLVVTSVGEGPDLVLIHGWGVSRGAWSRVLPRLACNFRVTELELPGYGVNSACRVGVFEELCAVVADALPSRAMVVGWSLGGLVALAIAARFPERVGRLALVASTPCFTQRDDWTLAMPNDTLNRFSDELVLDSEATVCRFVALQFLGVAIDKALVRGLQQAVAGQEVGAGVLEAGLGFLSKTDLRREFTGFEGDLRILLGGRDRLVPAEVGEALCDLNPRAQLRVISDAGHAPLMSHPDEFLEWVMS